MKTSTYSQGKYVESKCEILLWKIFLKKILQFLNHCNQRGGREEELPKRQASGEPLRRQAPCGHVSPTYTINHPRNSKADTVSHWSSERSGSRVESLRQYFGLPDADSLRRISSPLRTLAAAEHAFLHPGLIHRSQHMFSPVTPIKQTIWYIGQSN